ncbi:MAG: hypothetical protein JO110_19225 [Acetobacteraceae bacterium]|nr:hypothetical protein [Acetobacteraceae bacterium]
MSQSTSSTRSQQQRRTISFETAQRVCPHSGLAASLARTFGLELPDYAHIREGTEEHIARVAQVMQTAIVSEKGEHLSALTDKAMQIHLQRVVDAFVRSANHAGDFYSQKVSAARQLTSSLANDARDEDRDPAGFESRAQRARRFAAEMGLQAYALLAAAEGAISAYAHVTGEDWKPYDGNNQGSSQSLARRSAAEEMAAFGQ